MSVENGCYYCKSCDICDNKNCLVNKQKAEIERLTEELEEKNTYEEKLNSMIDNLRDDISEQKDEIERLTEERKPINDKVDKALEDLDKICYEKTCSDRINLVRNFILCMQTENAELQKQVDELKEKNNQLTDDGYIYQRKYELLEYEFERLKNHHDDGIRRAVKDIAKGIFTELFYMASMHHDVASILAWAKEKANSIGVEVE